MKKRLLPLTSVNWYTSLYCSYSEDRGQEDDVAPSKSRSQRQMKEEEAFDIYKGGTPRPGNKRKQP